MYKKITFLGNIRIKFVFPMTIEHLSFLSNKYVTLVCVSVRKFSQPFVYKKIYQETLSFDQTYHDALIKILVSEQNYSDLILLMKTFKKYLGL